MLKAELAFGRISEKLNCTEQSYSDASCHHFHIL